MITAVKGTLEASGTDWVVIAIGGVSLKVFVPSSAVEGLGLAGEQVCLFTHLQVREDGLALFGFPGEEALRAFEMLLGVSGVGPRLALSILSSVSPESLALSVSSSDVESLSHIPGLGKKMASRIVLELRGKLEKEWLAPAEVSAEGEVMSALIALGYTAAEARSAASSVPKDGTLALEERVRMALQQLGSP